MEVLRDYKNAPGQSTYVSKSSVQSEHKVFEDIRVELQKIFKFTTIGGMIIILAFQKVLVGRILIFLVFLVKESKIY